MPAAPPDLRARLKAALTRRGEDSSDLDLNPNIRVPDRRVLRPAAVLIGVTDTAEVILTKRSPRLRHHPGQVAFPGGAQDACDTTPADCALRETQEEIGLPPAQVEILGSLPMHETVTGFLVTPFVGLVLGPFHERPEAGEVEEVFRVPLAHVTDAGNFRIESRRWQGRRRYFYVVPFGPYYIWGATARMLRTLAARMQP